MIEINKMYIVKIFKRLHLCNSASFLQLNLCYIQVVIIVELVPRSEKLEFTFIGEEPVKLISLQDTMPLFFSTDRNVGQLLSSLHQIFFLWQVAVQNNSVNPLTSNGEVCVFKVWGCAVDFLKTNWLHNVIILKPLTDIQTSCHICLTPCRLDDTLM